jgi:hypothetical protein
VVVPVRVVAFDWGLLRWPEDDVDESPEPAGPAYGLQIGHLPQDGRAGVYPGAVDEAQQGAFAPTARLLELDRFAMPRNPHTTEQAAVADAEALLGAGLRWTSTTEAAP